MAQQERGWEPLKTCRRLGGWQLTAHAPGRAMPRIRSAVTAAASQQLALDEHQATDAFGSLALTDAG